MLLLKSHDVLFGRASITLIPFHQSAHPSDLFYFFLLARGVKRLGSLLFCSCRKRSTVWWDWMSCQHTLWGERDRPSNNNCPLHPHTHTHSDSDGHTAFSTCTQRKSCILYARSFILTFLSPLQSRSRTFSRPWSRQVITLSDVWGCCRGCSSCGPVFVFRQGCPVMHSNRDENILIHIYINLQRKFISLLNKVNNVDLCAFFFFFYLFDYICLFLQQFLINSFQGNQRVVDGSKKWTNANPHLLMEDLWK